MKTISRRTFLRGTGGAVLFLPALESLAAPKSAAPAQRMAFFYVPNGIVRRGFFPGEDAIGAPGFQGGADIKPIEGAKLKVGLHPLELMPTLKPLEKIKEKVTLVTGMDRTYQNGTDRHAQCGSCYLSSAAAFEVKSSAYPIARTLDHIVADEVGGETPFRTLEFSSNNHKDNKESIYFDNISWFGTGHVAPSIRDPRQAYARMFGPQETRKSKNITDLVLGDARSLQRELGYADRQKFAEYFDSIRAIEQRMNKLEQMRGQLDKLSLEEPTDAHLPRGQYIRLMGDLMVVALQTGLTRVATFMVGPERWDTPVLYEDLFNRPMNHHGMSHNQKNHTDGLLKIDHFHMQQYVYMLEKMDSIKEANGTTLLDNTIFTYGAGLGDGASHQYTDLPIVVGGGGGGAIRSGRHLHCADGTPLANLWLTLTKAMGLKRERFADSTRAMEELVV
jgi:hypothetical protein